MNTVFHITTVGHIDVTEIQFISEAVIDRMGFYTYSIILKSKPEPIIIKKQVIDSVEENLHKECYNSLVRFFERQIK